MSGSFSGKLAEKHPLAFKGRCGGEERGILLSVDLLRDQPGPDVGVVHIVFVAHNPAGPYDLRRGVAQSLIDVNTTPHFRLELIQLFLYRRFNPCLWYCFTSVFVFVMWSKVLVKWNLLCGTIGMFESGRSVGVGFGQVLLS